MVDPFVSNLLPNRDYYFVVRAKNVGNATWTKGNFRLGTTRPLNRMSGVCHSSWISCGRPATLTEDTVAPGQVGTFEFWIKTPAAGVETMEYFNPLQENVAWANDLGMNFRMSTKVAYQWEWNGQTLYTDQTKSSTVNPYVSNLIPDRRYYFVLRAKNIGNTAWTKGNFKLGTTRTLNRSSQVCDPSWPNCARPATLTEDTVAPGQVGTFEFWIKTPVTTVETNEYFNPLQENVAWSNDVGMHFRMSTKIAYRWEWNGQGLYTDQTKTSMVDPFVSNLLPNRDYYFVVRAKNVGNATWTKGNFRLGTTRPLNRMSGVCHSSWISCGRPATLTEDTVAPGQVGTFEFWIKTPAAGVETMEYFNPLQENVAWANDLGMNFRMSTK